MLFTGIAHNDVNLAEHLQRPSDNLVCKGALANIAADRDRLAARCFHDALWFHRAILFQQIDCRDVSAFARVERGDRSTDPAVGTGDYVDFSGKTVRALVARLPLGLWV
jgi:hypothetical protein